MEKHIFSSLPLGRSLAIVAKCYFGALSKRLEHLEIERYYSILILIENAEAGCTQQYLCSVLKMDKVSMVRVMEYLVNKDFVQKSPNPNDKRENFVKLTSKALAVLPEIHTCIDEVNEAAMRGLNLDQQYELHKNICLIQKNLEVLPSQKIYISYKKASRKI